MELNKMTDQASGCTCGCSENWRNHDALVEKYPLEKGDENV